MKIHTPILLFAIAAIALSDVAADKVSPVPGYSQDFNTSVYSGYLNLSTDTRGMHYVFVESVKGKNNGDPVTLWLNGGPGCSSLLGFLQEIGPYYLEQGIDYKAGDKLTLNPYSWHNASNLLFFESPAGVGYSYNTNESYQNNDYNTATDNMNALIDFFKKYPEYKNNNFWIAGQSYAGRYIPDLAVLIDKFNTNSGAKTINMKGILVGNGVMTFEGGQLQNSEAKYMMDHHFVDPDIIPYYDHSCRYDPDSAGCLFFHKRLQENVDEINPYNVYGYCFYNDSFEASTKIPGKQRPQFFQTQESLLLKTLEAQTKSKIPYKISSKFNGAPCSYFDGVFDYFNINEESYHAKDKGMKWNGPCAQNIKYTIDFGGSIQSYRTLLARSMEQNYSITLYNGDWDDVVPFHDTIKGIELLNLKQVNSYDPWFTDDNQHAGFHQLYDGLLYLTIKGASHQVPQSKRAQAYQFFSRTLSGHMNVRTMMQKQKAKKEIKTE